jgi:hypothetical protein
MLSLVAAALALGGAVVQSGPAAADTQDWSVASEQRPKLAVVLRGSSGTRVDIAPAAPPVTVIVINNENLTCRIHRGYQQARKHVHCSDGQIVQLPFN